MGLASSGTESPVSGFAVTPNDGVDLPSVVRELYVGVLGNVVALLAEDVTPLTYVGVQGVLTGRFKRVYATGTTATSIIGHR